MAYDRRTDTDDNPIRVRVAHQDTGTGTVGWTDRHYRELMLGLMIAELLLLGYIAFGHR